MFGLKGTTMDDAAEREPPRVRWHNAQSYAEHSPWFPKGVVDDETAAALPNPTVSPLWLSIHKNLALKDSCRRRATAIIRSNSLSPRRACRRGSFARYG